MKISLELIPGEVQSLAKAGANLGQTIKTALQSNAAIDITTLIDQFYPEAGTLRTELIALCTTAIGTCQKISTEDWSGVTARLQRMVTDSTSLLHGKQHTLSTYLIWCETEIRDLLDSAPASA